jgi:uncharacterized protein (DUF885 family)
MSRRNMLLALVVAFALATAVGLYMAQMSSGAKVSSVPVATVSPGTMAAVRPTERVREEVATPAGGGAISLDTAVATLVATPVVVATTPPAAAETPSAVASAGLDAFFESATMEYVLRNPELFTDVGFPASYKPDYRQNTLTDLTDDFTAGTYGWVRNTLSRLRAYGRAGQSPGHELSYDIMEWSLDDLARSEAFMYNEFPLNLITGAQIGIQDTMTNLHPLTNKQEADDYITRLGLFDEKFEGALEAMRAREAKDYFLSKWMMSVMVNQMGDFISVDAKENALYTVFKARVEPLSNISAEEKEALYAGVEKEINTSVYPIYRKMIVYFEETLPKGRDTDGVWALPNGDEYYKWALRHHTTTDMTPEEVHQLGLKEVARVQGEIRAILDRLGYEGVGYKEAISQVEEASGVHHLNSDQAKEAFLEEFRQIISRAETSLGDQFDVKPKVGVEVRAVPPYREQNSAGGSYVQPSLDGTRKGVFYVNLARQFFPRYEMPTLAYHEAVPGHHFQLAVQTELEGVPTFRRAIVFPLFTGYVEGWGLYAERLAADSGLYKDDPYGDLGRLKAELFRSARLVVDTGIHYKHWTQQQANKYMDDTLAAPPGAYGGEVARYIGWPGQACAYKIGEIRITELRERARTELGDKFNIKEFHNVVLKNGAVPLDVLEKLVEEYIVAKKAGS